MAVTPPSPEKAPQGGGTSFAGFLAVGLVWLVVGVLVGRYLFPEKVEKIVTQTVDRVVTQRVEVPVEKIVLKEVVKEVEKIVEVPVDKIVIKEIPVPVPMAVDPDDKNEADRRSPWEALSRDMTHDEVRALLGAPDKVVDDDDTTTWFYEERGQGVVFARFSKGGFFSKDKLTLWMAPDPRLNSKTNAGSKLLVRAHKARSAGNTALALVYAQAALEAEPGNQESRDLIVRLRNEIGGKSPSR